MKKTPKKLVLSRETLRDLTAEQAQGGALGPVPHIGKEPNVPWTSDSAKVCCA